MKHINAMAIAIGLAGLCTSTGVCAAESEEKWNWAMGEGVTFAQLVAPPSAKFYVWPDKRMVNPSPVYDAPLSLKAGSKLTLAYRLSVHARRQ